LLVPSDLASLGGTQIKQLYLSGSHPQVMPNVIYNILFENAGRSELFDSVQLLDPVRYRSAALDGLIFRISSTDTPDNLFTEHGLEVIPYGNQFPLVPERKALLVKTFIRSLYLNKTGFFEGELKYFHEFSHYLYCYYAGDQRGLVQLYRDMIKAIYYWNGNSKLDREVNVPVGRRQLDYNVTQTIVLNPDIHFRKGGSTSAEINEFDLSFPVGIKAGSHGIEFKLDIVLYVLLQNVIRGYSPNRQDREDHINFQQAIDRITTAAGQEQSINFEKIGGSVSEKFQLSYVPGFGYEFSKV
jgi:DNA phosphorothioation-dependent restriction protein DptF